MSVEPNSEVTTTAEIASLANLDRIGDVSVGCRITPNLGQAIPFRCVTIISRISSSKELFGDRGAKQPSLSKHPSSCEHRICAKRFHWFVHLDTRQQSGKT